MKETQERLRELLAKGEVRVVIDQLLRLKDQLTGKLRREVILISHDHNKLEDNKQANLIYPVDIEIKQARINSRLLVVIDHLCEKEDRNRRVPILYWGTATLSLAAMVFLVVYFGQSLPENANSQTTKPEVNLISLDGVVLSKQDSQPISGVIVKLSGGKLGQDTTNEEGEFKFSIERRDSLVSLRAIHKDYLSFDQDYSLKQVYSLRILMTNKPLVKSTKSIPIPLRLLSPAPPVFQEKFTKRLQAGSFQCYQSKGSPVIDFEFTYSSGQKHKVRNTSGRWSYRTNGKMIIKVNGREAFPNFSTYPITPLRVSGVDSLAFEEYMESQINKILLNNGDAIVEEIQNSSRCKN